MTIQNAWSNISGSLPSYAFADGQIGVQQADGILLSRNPDGTLRRTLLPKRYGVADAAFTARVFDTYIGISSLTASRVLALPPAASYPPGSPLTIADEAGAVSPTVTLTIDPNGTETVNGAATLALATPYGGAILYSDGVSKWTALALPAGTASNAVLYVTQSLTGGQQDIARSNVSGAMAAYQSATTTLALTDFDRDEFVTGTSTLTMPGGVAPGWRSGIITNDNPVTGLVTLAVPSGHSLDGTTNGSTILFPFQRARLQLVSAGAWRTIWVDRAPVISLIAASGVVSADINLPVGYSRFRFEVSGITLSNAGSYFEWRISAGGSAGIKSGNNDYGTWVVSSNGGSVAPSAINNTYGQLAPPANDAGIYPSLIDGVLFPGTATQYPNLVGRGHYRDNTGPSFITENFSSSYLGGSSGALGARANLLRLLTNIGTANFAVTVWGEP